MSNSKHAYLAGGCFWGMEELFRAIPGVLDTEVGYTGGKNENPTYEFHPGHAEALDITYDADVIDYKHILDFFFRIHNPTTINQQGNDKGTSYRSAIFYTSVEEKAVAEEIITIVNASKRWADPVVTTLEPLNVFYTAESYHQHYLQLQPNGYTCHYVRFGTFL
jgi:peptide-methionine (S)-S-oxide reductase